MSVQIHTGAYAVGQTAEASEETRARIRGVMLTIAVVLGVIVSCALAVLLHVG